MHVCWVANEKNKIMIPRNKKNLNVFVLFRKGVWPSVTFFFARDDLDNHAKSLQKSRSITTAA